MVELVDRNRETDEPQNLEYTEIRTIILTRRVGETLMIGDEVTVTVLGVRVTRYESCECTT